MIAAGNVFYGLLGSICRFPDGFRKAIFSFYAAPEQSLYTTG
jgi:hypothetical protein